MKFKDLSRDAKDFLIDQHSGYIESEANEDGVSDYAEPTLQEYEVFFDELDDDYEMVADYPESVTEPGFINRHSVEFDGKKVVLEVHPPYEEDMEYS